MRIGLFVALLNAFFGESFTIGLLLGLLLVSVVIILIIGYYWDKAAKANIKAWHELTKGTDLENDEPFYF